jgi:hypothetical protein
MSIPLGRVTFNEKSFFECVVERSKKLERLLEQNYQAYGNGLGVKARSVESRLDSDTVRQLRFIVAVRNKMMHEEGYTYDGNEDDFLRKCDEIIKRLGKPRVKEKPSTPPPPKVNRATNQSNTVARNYSYSSPSPSSYASTNSAPIKVREVHRPLMSPDKLRALVKTAFVVVGLVLLVYFGSQIISAIKYQLGRLSSSSEKSNSSPQPQRTVQVEKTSKGRTPNEKMYQFTVPAKTWVETSIKIKPNQEVNIHHFSSSERVTVNLGSYMDDRLQTPNTVIPLYTSKDCSSDRGVQAKVQYYCAQISQPETIKLYAESSVPVGVYIRNR